MKILCIGDSHTQGTAGCNWVSLLESKLSDELNSSVQTINCGENGKQAINIQRRIAADITKHDPSTVILLIGTNNCIGQLCDEAGNKVLIGHYNTINQLPSDYSFSPDTFAKEYRGCLEEAKAVAKPGMRILCVTLPPIGEDLMSPPNITRNIYNETIEHIVKDYISIAEIVPFASVIDANLLERQNAPGSKLNSHSAYDPTWVFYVGYLMLRAMFWRFFGYSYDSIAGWDGNCFLVDTIHLTDSACAILLSELMNNLKFTKKTQ